MGELEIRTELTLDGVQQLQAEFASIKDQILKGDAAREQAQKGFGSWLSQAHQLTGVLGVSLQTVVARVEQVAHSFLDAGSAAETGDQAVAALMMNASGYRADVAIGAAEELGDRLDDVAFSAGVVGDAVGDAFQIMLERGDASAEGIRRATEDVEKLALVSGKLGKNTGAIAMEYAAMQEGQLKVKGQLFQLLQSTGVFGDNAKKAAAAWGTLTEEKRAEILAGGLDKLTAKMKELPPTFNQAKARFEDMIRLAKEDVGQPIVEELTPAIEDLVADFKDMRPELQELGRLLAKELGVSVREGGKAMREALAWVKEHKGALVEDIKSAARTIRETFEFVLAHKEEIALAFGAKAIAGSGVVGAVGKGAGAVGRLGSQAAALDGGQVLGRAGGATGGVLALSAAVVGLGLAAEQAALLIRENEQAIEGKNKGKGTLARMAAGGDVEGVENTIRTERAIAEASGTMTRELADFQRAMLELAHVSKAAKDIGLEETKKKIQEAGSAARDIDAMSGTSMKELNEQLGASASFQVATLTNAYNVAMKSGDQQMALLAAQALASGQVVGQAFLTATKDVEGGFSAMADMLLASGQQFAGFATSLKGKAAQPPAPKILMPGAKITVTQDFRKADPDNVAVAFKRDIARAAERRAGARLAGVFGF